MGNCSVENIRNARLKKFIEQEGQLVGTQYFVEEKAVYEHLKISRSTILSDKRLSIMKKKLKEYNRSHNTAHTFEITEVSPTSYKISGINIVMRKVNPLREVQREIQRADWDNIDQLGELNRKKEALEKIYGKKKEEVNTNQLDIFSEPQQGVSPINKLKNVSEEKQKAIDEVIKRIKSNIAKRMKLPIEEYEKRIEKYIIDEFPETLKQVGSVQDAIKLLQSLTPAFREAFQQNEQLIDDNVEFLLQKEIPENIREIGFNEWDAHAAQVLNLDYTSKNFQIEQFRKRISEKLTEFLEKEEKDEFYLAEVTDKMLDYEIEIAIQEGNEQQAHYLKQVKGDVKLRNEYLKYIKDKQKTALRRFINYVTDKNNGYSESFQYFLLNSLTKYYIEPVYKLDENKKVIKENGIPVIETYRYVRRNRQTLKDYLTLFPNVISEIYHSRSFQNDILFEINKRNKEEAENNKEVFKSTEKGVWIIYRGKNNDPENYLENAKNLSALVVNTPWCLKGEQTAISYLEAGDIYVYQTKDQNGRYTVPRIGVAINNDGSMRELRGIENGSAQDVEEEMLPIAEEFITKDNPNIKGGKIWLDKLLKRKKEIYIERAIKNKSFEKKDIPDVLKFIRSKNLSYSYDTFKNLGIIDRFIELGIINSEDEIELTNVNHISPNKKIYFGNVNLSNYSLDQSLNLSNIIFVGHVSLSYYSSNQPLDLSNAIFIGNVVISNYSSRKGININNTIFYNQVDISYYSSEEGLDLSNVTFNGNVSLHKYKSKGKLNLINTTFNGNVNLSEYISEKGLDLNNATFNGNLNLSYYSSEEGLDLSNRTFNGGVYIQKYNSKGKLNLNNTIFNGIVDLSKYSSEKGLDLSNATFNEYVKLSEYSSEKGLNLSKTTFNGNVDLSEYSSEEGLNLSNMTFNGEVYIQKYKSKEGLNLSNMTFNGEVYIQKYNSKGKLNLTNTIFNKYVNLSEYISEKGLDLSKTTFNDNVDLSEYSSKEGLNLSNMTFNGEVYIHKYKSKGKLNLTNTIFNRYVTLSEYISEKGLDLSNAIFNEFVDISNYLSEEGIDLSKSTFNSSINLSEYSSEEGLDLSNRTFNGNVTLHQYKSKGKLNLSNTIFNGIVDLSKYSSEQGIILNNVTFNKYIYLSNYNSKNSKGEYNILDFKKTIFGKNSGMVFNEYFIKNNIFQNINNLINIDTASAELLFQDERGAILKTKDKSYIFLSREKADVTTELHEYIHEFERVLTEEERQIVLEWTGDTEWTKDTSEKFSKGFERFLYEGEVENENLKSIFKKFAEWLRKLFTSDYFKDVPLLTEKMKKLYNTILSEDINEIGEKRTQPEPVIETMPGIVAPIYIQTELIFDEYNCKI